MLGDMMAEATAPGTKESIVNTVIIIRFQIGFELYRNMLSILVTS